MINIEVEKGGTENTQSLMRRFSKRMQGSRIMPRMRKIRFYSRPASPALKKRQALRKLERRAEYEKQVKLGKVVEQRRGSRR